MATAFRSMAYALLPVAAIVLATPVAAQGLSAALAAAQRGDVAAVNSMRSGLDRVDQKIVDWYLIRMEIGRAHV